MRIFGRRFESPTLGSKADKKHGQGNGHTGRKSGPPLAPKPDKRPKPLRVDVGSTFSIGPDLQTGEIVDLSFSQLKRPVHLQGGTGERKTLFQVHLAERFIALTDAAVVYADFGEDQAGANYVLDAGKRFGRTTRLLSTVPQHRSATFAPLKPAYPLTLETAVSAKDYLMAALGLGHKDGKNVFWGKVNNISILRAMVALAKAGVTHPTLGDVLHQLEQTARSVRKQDAVEAVLEIEQLATQRILDPTDDKNEIDYDRVLENREVVYLLLGALLNSSATAIGGLNVWGAVAAAIRRKRLGLPRRRLLLIIDEYATVANSEAFSHLVTQCRKFGIAPLVLANQSTQQLQKSGNDQIVFDSTPTKIWLSPHGDDIETIRGLSKETWKKRKGQSMHGLSIANQISDFRDPTLERNDILDAAFTPMEGFLIEFGQGHKEPRRIRFEPPWTVEEWEEFENRPLPMREDLPLEGSYESNLEPESPRVSSEDEKRRLAVLKRLLTKKKDLESWEAA